MCSSKQLLCKISQSHLKTPVTDLFVSKVADCNFTISFPVFLQNTFGRIALFYLGFNDVLSVLSKQLQQFCYYTLTSDFMKPWQGTINWPTKQHRHPSKLVTQRCFMKKLLKKRRNSPRKMPAVEVRFKKAIKKGF